jgi:O-antigen/teichoic acid export membrane protein
LKLVFDNVFIAIKSASGTLVENIAFSAAKLAAPFLLVSLGFMGIFASQLAGALLAVMASAWLLHRRHAYRLLTRPSRRSLKGKWTFALGSYTSDIIGSLPANLLPIVVVSKLGPVAGSLWYTSMLMINLLLAISSSINQAMFAEISTDPKAVWRFVRKAAIAMYGLVTPLAIAIAILAPTILRLFGGQYVSGADTLRLMALFALIGIANYITGSILALYKKVLYLTLVNAANAAVVGLYCLYLAHDLRGIVAAWVWGEVVNVILFVGGCLYVVKRSKPMEELL